MKYDSLILDIDGTIWNTTKIVAGAWNSAAEEAGYKIKPITAEILAKEFGKPMDVIGQDLWPEYNEEIRSKILEICCVKEHNAVESNQENITYPGVVETIKELSKKLDLFVVSNCQAGYIELTLQKNGLTDYIKDHLCFGDTNKQKSENIVEIIKRNNLKAPAYIGDTQGDCNACKEANIPFIWAKYGFGTADTYVASLDNFSDLLTKGILE